MGNEKCFSFPIISAFQYSGIRILGDHGEGETPVPIPNTEVKPSSADGTARAAEWESRKLPGFILFYANG